MATEKQIHWMGEAAKAAIGFGFLYLIVRITDPSHRPAIVLPVAIRVMILLLMIAVLATLSTWRHYWKEKRRAARSRRPTAPSD